MGTKHTFCVAEHLLQISFEDSAHNDIRLLPSFAPFSVEEDNDGCLVYGNGNKCISTSTDMGSNNIVVFLTIQYYCLSLRHE